MAKSTNANFTNCASPGSTFNKRVSADSDAFDRNDVDALGSALDEHDHSLGKGLPATRVGTSGAPVTITGTPTVGQTLVATSATAAHWANAVSSSELYLEGTTAVTATSDTDLTYTSVHADTSVATTPATASWTLLRTGYYIIAAILSDAAVDNTGIDINIYVNGVSQATGAASVLAANATLQCGAYWHGVVTAGQVVHIQGKKGVGGATATGTVLIEFVPTLTYPS